MPTPLTNDLWDYESNCFVCEQSNEGGLRIPFQLDDDGDTVSASFRLGTTYSGAPALLHGGVSLALLDEAQAWACIAVAGRWALTASTAADFISPVFVDHPYRVEAEVTDVDDALVHTVGRVVGGDDATLISSISTFHIVGEVDVATGENTLDEHHRGLVDGNDV
jgi:acyl-coenzyme A thioesterase PaaI-like protein